MYVVFSQCKVSTSTDTMSVSGDMVFVGQALVMEYHEACVTFVHLLAFFRRKFSWHTDPVIMASPPNMHALGERFFQLPLSWRGAEA